MPSIPPDNTGKKYRKDRKEKGLTVTERRLKAAIPGSEGRISTIARKLNVTPSAIYNIVNQNKFPGIKQLIHDEEVKLCDMAEEAITKCIKQNRDYSTKGRTAFRFLESRRKKKWEKKQTIALEGGSTPIQLEHTQKFVKVDDLPLTLRRELLAQLNKIEDVENNGNGNPKIKVRKRV